MSVFADTAYYVALLVRTDSLHAAAVSWDDGSPGSRTVTTDAVLVEVLAYLSRRGSAARRIGADLVETLRRDPRATIVHQTPDLFFAGVELYRRRLDKGYSLTDCMSMVLCQEKSIRQILTHDDHFAQEGFTILL